ncbi:NAD(P)-dependent oxidoreductase [Henriciella sp.]|uniref:NAD-dependent epimerase/dehydratase family protein n=1 Tax=Henriciella sp. TaxID=1968823 RepID=UPI00260F21EE|nr:NAD(P)-dependent oxidoreductase [Henriciella sp.]
MRLLLTGSTGWLGRHLAPMLAAEGHEVVGLDVAPGPFTHEIGTVANRTFVDQVMARHGIEAILHGGALHKPDIARFPRQAFVDVNVTGTLNLLEAAVEAGHDRFVFTSTTSLMISQAIRSEEADHAVWIDERHTPLAPRNIYGATKLAAENLCRDIHLNTGLACLVLRTSRFFPEDDDTLRDPPPDNLKANEFLNRRLSVEDAARAHVAALAKAPELGFGIYIASAPTPFSRKDCAALKLDAASVIARYFPDAPDLYARHGWKLPTSISRIYDSSALENDLGFRCETDFAAILDALRSGSDLPFAHDAAYSSPSVTGAKLIHPG